MGVLLVGPLPFEEAAIADPQVAFLRTSFPWNLSSLRCQIVCVTGKKFRPGTCLSRLGSLLWSTGSSSWCTTTSTTTGCPAIQGGEDFNVSLHLRSWGLALCFPSEKHGDHIDSVTPKMTKNLVQGLCERPGGDARGPRPAVPGECHHLTPYLDCALASPHSVKSYEG